MATVFFVYVVFITNAEPMERLCSRQLLCEELEDHGRSGTRDQSTKEGGSEHFDANSERSYSRIAG